MKKLKKLVIFISLILLITTGCGNKKKIREKANLDLNFDDDYYRIATPYKEGVGHNYVVNNTLNNYDSSEVESSLMDISTNYFSTKSYKYQEGQYLKEKDLKKLLDREHLNKSDSILVDGITINPTYISYIHEQNYLNNNGDLKGVSIALVLNPYQAYKNENGNYLYKEIDEKKVLDFGVDASKKLLKHLRSIDKLKNTDILIGLYIQSNPESALPGSFRKVGNTSTSNISFNSINYTYQYLNSSYVSEHDTSSYTAFENMKNNVIKDNANTYLSGKGLYYNNKLKSLDITVTCTYSNKSKLIMLSQLISDEIVSSFGSSPSVKVNVKVNNETYAFINKSKGSTRTKIYIMKG